MAIRRFESNGRYSKVVEHNGILYIAGQVCSNPAGDIKAQTAETLAKIEEILLKYGSDKEHILSNTVYMMHGLLKTTNLQEPAWKQNWLLQAFW